MIVLPVPYPNETIYSVLARLQHAIDIPTNSMRREFPHLGVRSTIYKNLETLQERLPAGHPWKDADILTVGTTFWAQVFGQQKQLAEKLRNEVMSKGGKPGAEHSLTGRNTFLKWCPICTSDHYQKYGSGYWMRDHQPPTVTACWKHGVRLERLPAPRTIIGKYLLPEEQTAQKPTTATPAETQHSKTVSTILDGIIIDPVVLWTAVWEGLAAQGLALPGPERFWLRSEKIIGAIEKSAETVMADVVAPGQKAATLFSSTLGWGKLTQARALALLYLARIDAPKLKQLAKKKTELHPCKNTKAPCHGKIVAHTPAHSRQRGWVKCPECGMGYEVNLAQEKEHRGSPETPVNGQERPRKHEADGRGSTENSPTLP